MIAKSFRHTVIWLASLIVSFAVNAADGPTVAIVRVTGDRVNLRAAPSLRSEIVSQAQNGMLLVSVGAGEADWAKVVPPEDVSVWVSGEHVQEGKVDAFRLHVRAGPGKNYTSFRRLRRGEELNVLGSQGDWLRISPPNGCYLWISRQYVEPFRGASRQETNETAFSNRVQRVREMGSDGDAGEASEGASPVSQTDDSDTD